MDRRFSHTTRLARIVLDLDAAAMEPVVLSVAGVDPSAGAGLLADMETFRTHGARGVGVVTLLTVQSSRGVRRVECVEADVVREQLEGLLEDLPVAAIKTGALGQSSVVRAVSEALRGRRLPCVTDPVIFSTSGATLLDDEGVDLLRRALLPQVDVFTPNLAEAARLTGQPVHDLPSMARAATRLRELGARAVLLKGGHLDGAPTDLWLDQDGAVEWRSERVETRHTHGTGCALSSAIAARMAAGEAPRRAAQKARQWLQCGLEQAPGLGAGAGPLELRAKAPPFDLR